MFESLSDRLSSAFRSLSGRAQLTEENIRDGLREVRLALLEADVNFKVVKEFVERVRERVLGQREVEKSLTPTQQLVKAVHDELVTLLGGETTELNLRGAQPGVIMMVGLQGSGKTTSAGKLANLLRKQKMRPYLVPVDVYPVPPPSISSARSPGDSTSLLCLLADMKPVDIVAPRSKRQREAVHRGHPRYGGPLAHKRPCMEAAGGHQVRRTAAGNFVRGRRHDRSGCRDRGRSLQQGSGPDRHGLTRMDSDARGSVTLSIKSVAGASVKYVGVGEKLSDLGCSTPNAWRGVFLAWAICSRSSKKRRKALSRRKKPKPWPRRCKRPRSILRISVPRCARMKKIGSLENILQLIPGLGGLTSKLGDLKAPEREMARTEAVHQFHDHEKSAESGSHQQRRNDYRRQVSTIYRGTRSIRSCASSPKCVR